MRKEGKNNNNQIFEYRLTVYFAFNKFKKENCL